MNTHYATELPRQDLSGHHRSSPSISAYAPVHNGAILPRGRPANI